MIRQRCIASESSRRKPRLDDFVDSWRNRDQAIGDKPRSHPVTVCIAVLCEGPGHPLIVGASDRMLTSDLIEFEPRLSKIHQLTTNIVALIAGDTDVQAASSRNVRLPRACASAAESLARSPAAVAGCMAENRWVTIRRSGPRYRPRAARNAGIASICPVWSAA
jgi:xanthine dehydrogenase iron-sulfur cluster and FAD-binding subunit A